MLIFKESYFSCISLHQLFRQWDFLTPRTAPWLRLLPVSPVGTIIAAAALRVRRLISSAVKLLNVCAE